MDRGALPICFALIRFFAAICRWPCVLNLLELLAASRMRVERRQRTTRIACPSIVRLARRGRHHSVVVLEIEVASKGAVKFERLQEFLIVLRGALVVPDDV